MGVIVAAVLVKFPVFGYVLISWFLLGFANLWTAPLRVVYLADNIVIIAISSVLSWIGLAGATIISTLWATRFAPVGMSQVFISIHFFLIGVRGIVGPPIGFYVASHLPLRTVGMISFFLGCISLLMLIPIIRKPLGSTSWRG